jgi:ribulose-phosphate 3-epimerase
MQKRIAASILAADFANLGDDTKNALNAGVDYIHFDVMDYHFVPNLSFGAVVCQALRQAGITAPIDVHLMVENPELYIEPFAKAGANLITFHPETVTSPTNTIAKIRNSGLQAGIAINPDKLIELPDSALRSLDMILLMSVYPGFGGQAFIPESIEKIRQVRHKLDKLESSAMLGVDGGVKVDNIGAIAVAGADFFVVGSGLFNADNYEKRVRQLRDECPQ